MLELIFPTNPLRPPPPPPSSPASDDRKTNDRRTDPRMSCIVSGSLARKLEVIRYRD